MKNQYTPAHTAGNRCRYSACTAERRYGGTRRLGIVRAEDRTHGVMRMMWEELLKTCENIQTDVAGLSWFVYWKTIVIVAWIGLTGYWLHSKLDKVEKKIDELSGRLP